MMEIIMAEEFNNQLYVRADVVQLHIKEAVNAEREACAKVCEEVGKHPSLTPRHCAEAIRARGQG